MSIIDQVLNSNGEYAKTFELNHLTIPPARKLAVIACMDARLTIEEILGLETGDAHIVRNAGGIVTEDALRSILISHYLLGTQEFMVINHTDCGMLSFNDSDLSARLHDATGTAVVSPDHFYAFDDLEANVCEQIEKLKSHPWVPKAVPIRGFIYDVKTGRLHEVTG